MLCWEWEQLPAPGCNPVSPESSVPSSWGGGGRREMHKDHSIAQRQSVAGLNACPTPAHVLMLWSVKEWGALC